MYVREHPDHPDHEKLTFTVSGKLWNRSLVMLDQETNSLWSHLLGRAMEGELKGTELETLPSTMVDWKTWKTDHPDTTVLALSRTHRDFVKEFHEAPNRFVLGLRTLTEARSYSFDILRQKPVVNDVFAEKPVVVVFRPDSAGGRAFDRRVEGKTLTFQAAGDEMRDAETGSTWDLESGACTAGALQGKRLSEIPAIVSFRRAWEVFYPESESYAVE